VERWGRVHYGDDRREGVTLIGGHTMNQHCLVGKTIIKIRIAEDKRALLFITDGGEIIVRADGDCCSDTWIEHIELPTLPAKVASVEDIDMPDLGSPSEYECIQYYGCKITTDKGVMVIDYRNESNGYYGGSLSWPDDDYFYGGVHGQNVSDEKWKDLDGSI
jgi:hypothetical protein